MKFITFLLSNKKELNPFTEEEVIDIETPAQLDRVELKFKKIKATIDKALEDEGEKLAG